MNQLFISIVAVAFAIAVSISDPISLQAKKFVLEESEAKVLTAAEKTKNLEELTLYYHFISRAMIKHGLAEELTDPQDTIKMTKDGVNILEQLEKEGRLDDFDSKLEGICFL